MSSPQGQTTESSPALRDDEKLYGMLCHVTSLSGYIIPFGHILGPLIVWLMKKNESPYVDAQGREALNFQISCTIYGVVSAVLMLVLIGFFMLLALGLFHLIMVILTGVKAFDGKPARYPLCIRFL